MRCFGGPYTVENGATYTVAISREGLINVIG